MSDTPSIYEQLTAIYQDIAKRVETHFNQGLEYSRYLVKDISCYRHSTYMAKLGSPMETTLLHTDVRFEVKLGDVASYNFATAIECRVNVRSDGELVIDDTRRTEQIKLQLP